MQELLAAKQHRDEKENSNKEKGEISG